MERRALGSGGGREGGGGGALITEVSWETRSICSINER